MSNRLIVALVFCFLRWTCDEFRKDLQKWGDL